jgi:hypothetical protein
MFVMLLIGCSEIDNRRNEVMNNNSSAIQINDDNITNALSEEPELIENEFSVFLDFSVDISSDFTVTVTGNTNLPDETKLKLTLVNDSGYEAIGEVSVIDGSFKSGVFSNKGISLESGNYTISVKTLNEQPKSVENDIGVNGEYLIGEFVKSVGSFKIVEKSISFTISIPEEEVEKIELKKKLLLAAGIDGSNYQPLETQDSFEGNSDEEKKWIEENPLQILDIKGEVKGNYIYVSGAVKNRSNTPHSFIKIKVIYTDYEDNVVDTDWTYLDSEELKPNEQKYFEIMTKYRKGMDRFKVEILDYD